MKGGEHVRMNFLSQNVNLNNTVNGVEELNAGKVIDEMQQRVIDLQDHQISFLNDSLSNFLAVAGVSIAITTFHLFWNRNIYRCTKPKSMEKNE